MYQRPSKFTLKPDLTDLRSWRNNLSDRSINSGAPTVPSFHCYAGTAVEWIGDKILSSIFAVESYRRLWRAGKLTKRMKRVPGTALESWLVKHEKQVNQLLNDLLELSSYADCIFFRVHLLKPYYRDGYQARIQKRSIERGLTFQEDLIKAEYHHKPEFSREFLLITSKATPL
jgi:hypothetical protein